MFDLKGYESSLLEGAWMTLQVALLSLSLAAVLGMLGALAKLSRHRMAKGVATFYTTVVRGIPDLVLMMLLFFGGQVFVNFLCTQINEGVNNWLTQGNPQHEWPMPMACHRFRCFAESYFHRWYGMPCQALGTTGWYC